MGDQKDEPMDNPEDELGAIDKAEAYRGELDQILTETNRQVEDDDVAGKVTTDEAAAAVHYGEPTPMPEGHEGPGHTLDCGGDTCSKVCTCGTCPPMPAGYFGDDDKTPRPAPTGPGDGPGGVSLSGAAKAASETMKVTIAPAFANQAMTVMLEKIRIGLKTYVSPAVLDQMNFDQSYDPFTDRVMMELGMYLFSNKIHTETIKEDFPAGWFQSFKESLFPGWLKSKFPVKYTQVFKEVKTIHICPHLNYRTRDEEKFHLQFLIPEGDLTRYQA